MLLVEGGGRAASWQGFLSVKHTAVCGVVVLLVAAFRVMSFSEHCLRRLGGKKKAKDPS